MWRLVPGTAKSRPIPKWCTGKDVTACSAKPKCRLFSLSGSDAMSLPNETESYPEGSAEDFSASVVPSDAPPFTGDTGQLSIETRRVLVQLLLGPSVDARRQ